MKVALILCLAVTEALASTAKKYRTERRYDPSEENKYRIKTILVKNSDGHLIVQNLTNPVPRCAQASADDVKFWLYTLLNPVKPDEIPGTDFAALKKSDNFDSSVKSVFIVHGWDNNYRSPINKQIRRAIRKTQDANVFVVDWSGPASKLYPLAQHAVPVIGKVVAEFIKYISLTYDVSKWKFLLIGHSLGAHVVGCAGAALNGQLPVIVGLDPAGLLYTVHNIHNRIDESDAKFVHIIHTNTALLGFNTACGTADYYPNGGDMQPGCGLDVLGFCSHRRAYLYYAESILKGAFKAKRCNSQRNYKYGKCKKHHSSLMGGFNVDKKARGDYYLTTYSKHPFALN